MKKNTILLLVILIIVLIVLFATIFLLNYRKNTTLEEYYGIYSLENHSIDLWVQEGEYISIYCTECDELVYKGKPNYDLNFKLNKEQDGYIVMSAGKAAQNEVIVIPQTYNGLPVTEIQSLDPEYIIIPDLYDGGMMNYKYEESNIKTVFISPSVKYLNEFFVCDKLETVYIPSGLLEMETWTFSNCNSLKNIYVSSDNPNYKSENGILYTKNGSKLIRFGANRSDILFEVPNEVTVISQKAFSNASNLKSITLSDSLTTIELNAFEGCTSLENIVIPNSVTSINGGAFRDCISLESVSIGNGVQELGRFVFYGCKSLKDITVDQNNLYFSSLDGNLYDKDGYILIRYAVGNTQNSFSIPSGVITIGTCSFEGAEHLKEIIFSETVTTIKGNAFHRALSLEIIHLPTSLKNIEENAFDSLTKIKEVHIKSLSSWLEVEHKGLYSSPFCDSADLYVNGELLEHLEIPSYVSEIPGRSFMGCQSIKTVIISGATQTIGQSAFFGCKSIESVDIKDGVKSIEGSAFYGCSSLKEVNIPVSVKYIGNYAFYKCTSLKSLGLPYPLLIKVDMDRIFSNTP